MDQVRPYHAGNRTQGQEAAAAVFAVMSHAAERDEAQQQKKAPKKQANWMLPVAINLGVFAVYLLLAPPAWVVLNPIEAAPNEEQTADMRLAMYMQAMRVDAYRGQNGELPVALEDAGSTVSGIEYSIIGSNRYELIAAIGTEVVRYESFESPNQWVGSDATIKLRGVS